MSAPSPLMPCPCIVCEANRRDAKAEAAREALRVTPESPEPAAVPFPVELLRVREFGQWLRVMDYGPAAPTLAHPFAYRRYACEVAAPGEENEPDAWGIINGGAGIIAEFATEETATAFAHVAAALTDYQTADMQSDGWEAEEIFWHLLSLLQGK